ncbi:MAG: hypothetical protein ACKVOL_02010 [Novosphingobium sp.]
MKPSLNAAPPCAPKPALSPFRAGGDTRRTKAMLALLAEIEKLGGA